MRWVFPDPNDREENVAREAVRARIDAWWKAFVKNRPTIEAMFAQQAEFDLVTFMQNNLQCIDQQLMWEFGPALTQQGHRLAISPEIAHHLHPLTDEVLKRAPRISGFEFYHGRPPEGAEAAAMTVEGRFGVDISRSSVNISIGEMNRVDARYFFPAVKDPQAASNAAFIASESLFGETRMDSWVGTVEALPRPEGADWIPLEQAADAMQRCIDAVRASLPDSPCATWVEDAEFTMLEMNTPEEWEPNPFGFGDLQIASVPHAEMIQGILGGVLFHSNRYSRHRERFCCLKLDESEFAQGKRFEFRRPAEDSVDKVLRETGTGCTIGGGSGVWFGYSLLALTDVARAIPVIRKVLRQHKAPANSWLLFLDYDWCDEWVGIYDDTPPPPMPPLDADG